MNSTLGAPSLARRGSGQAELDWSTVSPMTPGKAVPSLYSLSDMCFSFELTDVLRCEDGSMLLDHSCRSLQLDCDLAFPMCRRKAYRSELPVYLPGNENTCRKHTVFAHR